VDNIFNETRVLLSEAGETMRRAQQAAMELRDIFERTLRLMNKISRDLTMLSGPTFQQFLGYPIERHFVT
jgi:hypothetical protein